jgi:hypothetical protein
MGGTQITMASSVPPPMDDAGDRLSGERIDVDERRSGDRIEVSWPVDCETDETFLYASIANISELGIFVRTDTPLAVGTFIRLRFTPRAPGSGFVNALGVIGEPFALLGRVQWVNELRPFGDNLNPGMGIAFMGLSPDDRERLVSTIRTIAYLRSDPPAS